MTRIRFEDDEKNIHTIDIKIDFYLEEALVYGSSHDCTEFSVCSHSNYEEVIRITETVFNKLKDNGLKSNGSPRIWFEALDNKSYAINPWEKCILIKDQIFSDNRKDYDKFYLYTENANHEVEISERVFKCLKNKGIPVEHN